MREVVLEGFSNYVINDSGDNDKTVWSKINNCWLTPTNNGNLIKIWKSTLECGSQYCRGAVSKCCNNKYLKDGNKYKGYIWSFIPL